MDNKNHLSVRDRAMQKLRSGCGSYDCSTKNAYRVILKARPTSEPRVSLV